MNKIKFCLFSDFHYWEGHYPQGIDKLEEIMSAANKENVDFVISCGDLCHNIPTSDKVQETYFRNPYKIPVYNCFGNHEQEAVDSTEEVCRIQNMKNTYEYYDFNGFRLIILDTNYFKDEDGVIKRNPPHSYGRPDGDRLGPEQLSWLEEAINTSPYPCILFSHASFEKGAEGSPDAAAVREILQKANTEQPGKVLMCCNGHYHRDNISVSDNILWFDVNAALNVEWQPKINTLFPEEFINTARMTKNCCFSVDPLYAIVSVSDDGHIVIKGQKSDYLYGASPEKLGWVSNDRAGRPVKPYISDADVWLEK